MINPKLLCRKHLLGEHGEIHKHLPSLRKGVKIDGRMHPIVQIQLYNIEARHDYLAEEMLRRGMNHKSPLLNVPDLEKIYPHHFWKTVDVIESARDLQARCRDCFELIEKVLFDGEDEMSLIEHLL